jgi:hypothetical protein
MFDTDLTWRKSTRSDTLHCVELTRIDVGHCIRDSKNPGQKLDLPTPAVRLLIHMIQHGRSDII